MALSQLNIQHFRNLKAVSLTLNSGFNFLIGHNGSGKTSLLEAIYFLGHGRSFKSSVIGRVIQYEQPAFTLFAKIEDQQSSWSVGLQKTRQGESTIRINGEDGNKISDLAHLLPMQLITPEGLTLINGGPSYRRAFLDWGLFHLEPGFHQLWSMMNRLLKQRNAALQQVNDYAQIKIWDQQLYQIALQISQWRQQYADALKAEINATCQLFLPEVEIDTQFYQGWAKESDYAEILETNFQRDQAIGYTMSGPQRADFKFKANGLPAEDILSRGQLKLLMCALRLAQGEHLMQQQQRRCIFLIDDFASELDPNKRALLAQRLKESQSQVIITAITPEQLQQPHWQDGAKFQLQQGEVEQLS
ncbi:DNA replication/repair protein RecF [Gallibacterium sp. AGMB14963]|uniref:DNA replication/repair protein RecF n=1 Tax=Gallibacterium faecale TaxID=3019086 RepID=UPI0022F1B8BF|nr:DNA replication/repair protein RecF [Gallibacterium sp. AGMB14963]MDA3978002.1 DNA replication/repair protein RecF [Gallibacterium sp. AGMB14963]